MIYINAYFFFFWTLIPLVIQHLEGLEINPPSTILIDSEGDSTSKYLLLLLVFFCVQRRGRKFLRYSDDIWYTGMSWLEPESYCKWFRSEYSFERLQC
uniref:Hypothetical secreted protein n=1 Tax=Glossina morsitans morsitans TaxID=37546 RepID=D3TLY6_GLOMM